jgi:ubiquinone/menaquinone biosynthesis C-methylase UbiE
MFSSPEQNILRLSLTEGMRVADFGAGTGFYSKACSPRVGMTGKIFAIEVQKDLVKKLETELRNWGISNVECVWGDIERRGGTKLSDGSIDVVIVSNVLSLTEDRVGLIEETKRILKRGGKVLLIDWTYSFSVDGPKAEKIINEDKARELFEKRGFKFEERINAGANHYGIIFKYE